MLTDPLSKHATDFLNLAQKPIRLNSEQTAWLLNCRQHSIRHLVKAKLIKPLGSSCPKGRNSIKYFGTREILEIANDPNKLGRITDHLYEVWKEKRHDTDDCDLDFAEAGSPSRNNGR
jgi:hypothetical protein